MPQAANNFWLVSCHTGVIIFRSGECFGTQSEVTTIRCNQSAHATDVSGCQYADRLYKHPDGHTISKRLDCSDDGFSLWLGFVRRGSGAPALTLLSRSTSLLQKQREYIPIYPLTKRNPQMRIPIVRHRLPNEDRLSGTGCRMKISNPSCTDRNVPR